MSKGLIILIWLLIISIGPVTLLINTDIAATFNSPLLLINFFQRLTGMLAFTFLFLQILLGSYLHYWQRYLGAMTLKYHIFEGLFIYGLILAHPLLYVVFNLQAVGKITLFILPNLEINTPIYELYLTYGRIGFVLLTIGVTAGLLRQRPFLRAHWRKFHILNYFSFFFVAVHAFNVGTDVLTPPFSWFYWAALLVISLTVVKRFIYPKIKPLLANENPSQST